MRVLSTGAVLLLAISSWPAAPSLALDGPHGDGHAQLALTTDDGAMPVAPDVKGPAPVAPDGARQRAWAPVAVTASRRARSSCRLGRVDDRAAHIRANQPSGRAASGPGGS